MRYDQPMVPESYQAKSAQDASSPEPLLLQILKRLEQLIKTAGSVLDCLRNMNNRVLGDRPRPTQHPGDQLSRPEVERPSMQESINSQFSVLTNLIGQLSEEVDRANNEIA
jgi:hypothetical protein